MRHPESHHTMPEPPAPAPAPVPAPAGARHGVGSAAREPGPMAAPLRRRAAAAVALLLPVAGWLIWKFLDSEPAAQPSRKIAQITLVRPPPPPPPKPPEKPPEPPRLKQDVKIEQPKPVEQPKPADDAPKAAPPPGPLGVEGSATGSGDGFGLAARSGGTPLTEQRPVTVGGAGTAQQRMSHALFGNGVARHIAQELARLGDLRGVEYRVELRIWLGRDGRIERHELVRGSGDAQVDQWVEQGLARIATVRQSPPEGMGQPLRIRVTSADA